MLEHHHGAGAAISLEGNRNERMTVTVLNLSPIPATFHFVSDESRSQAKAHENNRKDERNFTKEHLLKFKAT